MSNLQRPGGCAAATLSQRRHHGPGCSASGDQIKAAALPPYLLRVEEGPAGSVGMISAVIAQFVQLSPPSQAVVVLVVGAAVHVAFRLLAAVLRLLSAVLSLVPKKQAPKAAPASPRCVKSVAASIGSRRRRACRCRCHHPLPPRRFDLRRLPPSCSWETPRKQQQPQGVSLKQLQKSAAKAKAG